MKSPRSDVYPFLKGTALTELNGPGATGAPRQPKGFTGNQVTLTWWLDVPLITFGTQALWPAYPSDVFTYLGDTWLILMVWRKGPTTTGAPTSNLLIDKIRVGNGVHPDAGVTPNAISVNNVTFTFRMFRGDLSAPVGPTHEIFHQMSNSNVEMVPAAANPLILTGGPALATDTNVLALRLKNDTLGGANTVPGKITVAAVAEEI